MLTPCIENTPPMRGNLERSSNQFEYYLFLFTTGSIGGFCLEVAFRSVCHGSLQIPGLLFGPYCPIYGMGLLLTMLLSRNVSSKQAYLRIVVAASVLEYIISLVCEVLFGLLLWDYSCMPLSLGTRVNLLFSLAWGFLGLVFLSYIEPRARELFEKSGTTALYFSRIVISLISLDTFFTVITSV